MRLRLGGHRQLDGGNRLAAALKLVVVVCIARLAVFRIPARIVCDLP